MPLVSAEIPEVKFEKHVLPNGLELILHVDKKLPVVHVNEWFHVGSKNERRGRSGFAHLFEHIMFEGSKNAPEGYWDYAEKIGANLRAGGVNGTTDWDRTNYFITVPSGNLEYVLWLESDRLATLAEALTEEKLKNQIEVVRNERRQGLENRPYGRWMMLISRNLYPEGHPYQNDIIGSHEDLQAATLDDVRDFFKTYYAPNNLTLTIAGDFDPPDAKRLVEKYFGSIPAGPALDRPARWIPEIEGQRVVNVRDRVPQERTYFAWHSPGFFQPGDAELDLVSMILTDGLSSRLNKVLVYDKRLCSDVNSFQVTREYAGFFVVNATARPGASMEEVEDIISEEIARLAKEGPAEEELNRAKTKWEYNFVSGLERIGGFGGKADQLNRYNTFLGDPGKLAEDFARYRNATTATLKETVGKWLNTQNRLLARFRPETSGRPMEVTLDRSQAPPLGEDRPFKAPDVLSSRLDNGLEILVVERRDLPKVAVRMVTKAGSADDPPGKDGLADLTVGTMEMGTETRNALEIERALGDLGTSITGFASREYSVLAFEVLTRNLPAALAIFTDVARNPVFPESEVDLQKKRRLDSLARTEKTPSAIAGRVSYMLAFGPDHPYGTASNGLPRTVEKMNRDDFAEFYSTYWKPGSSAMVFAGDISLAEAEALARRHFGDWSGGARPPRKIPEPKPAAPGKVYMVDVQDAAQTEVSSILPGPTRKADDYYVVDLANTVWGGTAGSRLNLNIREEKGYSYGVFASAIALSEAGMWRGSGGMQTDKTKEALAEFNKELREIAGQRPVTGQELADAKAKRIRGYAQQFESLGHVAGEISSLWSMNLPMTELQRAPEEFGKATLEQVNAVAESYAAPSKAIWLLVGDAAKIEAGIRELNLGEIVRIDSEGKPLGD